MPRHPCISGAILPQKVREFLLGRIKRRGSKGHFPGLLPPPPGKTGVPLRTFIRGNRSDRGFFGNSAEFFSFWPEPSVSKKKWKNPGNGSLPPVPNPGMIAEDTSLNRQGTGLNRTHFGIFSLLHPNFRLSRSIDGSGKFLRQKKIPEWCGCPKRRYDYPGH
jgi:hypothetical protein